MKYVIAMLAIAAMVSVSKAESIAVNNGSFEAPALDVGGWTNDLPANGWTQLPENGSAFVEYIDTFSAEGNQHLGMAEGAEVYQDLGVGLSPNTTYTLSVSAGNRNASFTPETGQVSTFSLYLGNAAANGGTELASGSLDAFPLGELTFSDALTVDYTTGDAVDAGNLFISLASTGAGRAHFDNVSLEANAVPEPTSLVLAALAGLGLLQVRRRS